MSSSSELRPLLRLALPVILAEIGWMTMGIVDTIMVGPLGPAAIGAAGVGSGLFTALAIFGMGLMLSLDALVSQAYGARRLDECLRWMQHGVVLSLLAAVPVAAIGYTLSSTMPAWGLNPDIERLAQPYTRILLIGTVPLLLYATARRYLQGLHHVRPVMFALVSANLVNAAGNWLLIHGHLGLPRLGVSGSAIATVLARCYMAAVLFIAIAREHRRRGDAHPDLPFAISWSRLWELLRFGVPAASQITLEVGVFAATTAMAGKLDAISSASHQIALNLASLAFMVQLGLASAGSVRVGYAVGMQDLPRARRAGWTALAVGTAVMVLVALLFMVAPGPLVGLFSRDPRVIQTGSSLLLIAAAFQLFDGAQAVATGILRGMNDTRTAMLVNVVGHWILGFPTGYVLCFILGWGVQGLWVGLSIGLVFVAVVLTLTWARRTAHLRPTAA